MKNKLIKTSTMTAIIVVISFTVATSTASAHNKCRYIKQPGVTIKVCDTKGHHHNLFNISGTATRRTIRSIGQALSAVGRKQ